MSSVLAISAVLALAAAGKLKAARSGSRSTRSAAWPQVRQSMLGASAKHAGGPRDARWALGYGEEELVWTRERYPVAGLKVEPISSADVRRYARRMSTGEQPPPVVLAERDPGRFAVIDGAHRVAAAKSLGLVEVDAWVGRLAPARTLLQGSKNEVSFRKIQDVPRGYAVASWPFVQGTVLEDVVTEPDEDEDEEPSKEDRLYHVTTAASKVLASRIKSRAQLRKQGSEFAGLGGGVQDEAADLVSVSVTLGRAVRTRNAMRVMVRAAKGQILASDALIEAMRWNDFPACLNSLKAWEANPDEVEDEDASAFDEAMARFQLQVLSPDDEVYAGPLDTQEQWIDFILSRKSSIDENDPYYAVRRFEHVFSDFIDLFPDAFDVCAPGIGFLMAKQSMVKIDEEDVKILSIAAKGGYEDIVPVECELRFKSNQLVVVGVEV